ncbi:DUF6518 family protein [Micromonospora sp. RTGN7]|uniref:DUF6518 family protein n=1 Tax=Micromonospora sp. RTGN7 TaxID=3016526 RepID=UPI0029FEDB1E|nr:DUF6518 family protein [Micromonospora sp. RTGN7]
MTELKALGGRWARREVLPPVFAGVALGMAAFTADLVPEAVGRFLVPAFSSGFAWGVVALAVSYYAPTLRSAFVAGVGTLALATLTYYGLVASLSRQWLSDSGPALPPDGLYSVTRASVFWLAGALFGGLILGCLAHVVRVGAVRDASIALGVAFGLLAGEAAYAIFYVVIIWVGPVDSFVWARLGAAAVQLLLAAVVACFALRLRRLPLSLWLFLMTATVSTAASAASWHLVESVRMTL